MADARTHMGRIPLEHGGLGAPACAVRPLRMRARHADTLHPMKRFLVGGAVRDRLLGRPGGDRDWVLVGASPDELVKQGYLPVGKDFPVFLHPDTREECA